MPKVAINKVTPSWLTSFPRTKRSTTQASMIITPIAKIKAIRLTSTLCSIPSKAGIHSAKRAMANAANKTMAPWAKLKTPDALKISTKPRATSEYSMPVIKPPIKVSRNGPMLIPYEAQKRCSSKSLRAWGDQQALGDQSRRSINERCLNRR